MVEIVQAEHPGLVKGVRFRFRNRCTKATYRDFFGNPKDQAVQREIVRRIEQQLENLHYFACRFNLRIGIEACNQVFEGQVDIYDQRADGEVQAVMRSVQASVTLFWATYPEAGFMIDSTQTIEITKIFPLGS